MAPIALLVFAYVVAIASVPASAAFKPKKSDALLFGALNSNICVVNLKTKENMMFHVKGNPRFNQLALDPEKERIYWTDTRAHSIASARWDGTDQKTIYKAPDEEEGPRGLAVDASKSLIFYSVMTKGSIHSVDTDGKNARQIIRTPEKQLIKLAVDAKNQYIFYSYHNEYSTGIGRVGYNGQGDMEFAQWDGITADLTFHDGRIYWDDGKYLKSNKVDGSDEKTEGEVKGTARGFGIWGEYFVSSDIRKITVTRLPESKTTVIMTARTRWFSLVVHVPPKGGTATRDSGTNGKVQDIFTDNNSGISSESKSAEGE